MKKSIQLILFLFLSMTFVLQAQVSEEEKTMSQGVNNAVVVNIPTTTTKIAERVWKNYAKKEFGGKTKRNRKTEEWTTTDAQMASFSEEKVTIYAQIQSNNEDVELAMWIPGVDGYLSSTDYPDAYKEAEKLLDSYALEVRIETVNEEMKDKEKILGKLEKDLKKLKKDNDGYHKDIKNAERKITESEEGLIKNAEDQEVARQNVRIAEDYFVIQRDSLEDLLAVASNKDEKKSLKKELKGEERKVKMAKGVQKKEEREENKLRRTIENSKKTIKDSEEKIVTNLKEQERKVEEIAKQEKVVEEVADRLKKLKDLR